VPSLGTSEALAGLWADGVVAVNTITPWEARKKYAEQLDSLGFVTPSLIFPTAIIDEHARIGKGCIIRH
jgi:UDP-3-O-[3-hydroxymyristoyl] glucosamine N-acyltransferase